MSRQMHLVAHLPLALLLGLAPACTEPAGGDDEAGTTTDAGTETTTGTGTGTETGADTGTETGADTGMETGTDTDTGGQEPCPCVPPSDEQQQMESEPPIPDCEAMLCPKIQLSYEGIQGETYDVVDNPEAVDCALEALRDRTPGMIRWFKSERYGSYDGYLLILDDGTAIDRWWGFQGFSGNDISDAWRGELRPAQEFEACLAEPDPLLRYQCVRMARADELQLCDAGWLYDL